MSVAHVVSVTNSGSATLALTSIAMGGANPKAFTELTTCGPTLAPAASCAVYVSFKPTVAGTFKASIAITDNGASSPQSIALTGATP
jgi:hypothetical protein